MNQFPNQQQDMETFEMEGFYEYKGIEKYNPTQEFLKKLFLIANIQAFLYTILYFIIREPILNYFETEDSFGTIFVIYAEVVGVINICAFLCTTCCSNAIRSREAVSYVILIARIIGIALLLSAFSDSFKQTLVLMVTLHTVLTVFAYHHEGEFAIRNTLKWVAAWAGVMFCVVYLKGMAFEEEYSVSRAFLEVMKVVVYGVYLVVNTSIILGKDEGYEVNHHEHVFAALLLQFDMTMVVSSVSRCIKFITKRE